MDRFASYLGRTLSVRFDRTQIALGTLFKNVLKTSHDTPPPHDLSYHIHATGVGWYRNTGGGGGGGGGGGRTRLWSANQICTDTTIKKV